MGSNESNRTKTYFQYLTCSEEDEKWQLVCTDAGFTEVPSYTFYPPNKSGHPRAFQYVATGRTLNEFQIVYITKGKGVFETLGKKFDIIPGSIMIVFPGIKHFYKPIYEVGWYEHWVGFKGPYADSLVKNGFLSLENPCFIIGLQNQIIELFSEIVDEVREQKPLYQIKAASKIIALIAEILATERRQAQPSQSEKIVEQAKFLMEESIYDDIDLNSIASQVGVSTSKLNEIFKTYTSMTPYQYYIHIKLHAAKALLEQGDLSIKEVAFRLGFEDQYHFSRLFKSKTGIAPSLWKDFVYQ